MRSFLFLFLFSFLYHFTSAKEKILINAEPAWLQKINADLNKTPLSKTISNGYYLELIDNQVNLINNTEYTHFIRHIINESGVQNASEVSVSFSPEFEQVAFHKIIIIRDGKIINQLSQSQIKVVQEETDASDFQYNGLKRAFVTLKGVQKNDRIEVAYSVTGFNPVFQKKYSRIFSFYSGTAVSNYFLTIISNETKKLFIKTFNNAVQPVESTANNIHTYEWNNPFLKIGESKSNAPSWFSDYPYVSITEYRNWQEVVDWGLNIFNNYNYQLPQELKNKIAAWHKIANGDNDLFASLAIRFVQQQIRYLGLEIGTYTHQPHSPAEVYLHRFGDCKDKALLLTKILQEENIRAYVALVNTDMRYKMTDEAPSATAFDHAIVAIERSADVYIYVDPTISSQRGELVNLYVPAYGYALIIRDNENKLNPVDPGYLYNTSIVETLNVYYKDSSSFKVETVCSGGAADDMRGSFADLSNKELEDNCREFYEKIFDGIQVDNAPEQIDDTVKNEVTLKESYVIPHLWHENTKGKDEFEVFAKSIYEHLPDPTSNPSNTPMAISYPRKIHYSLEINMPDDWPFNTEELHVKNNSYQFDFFPIVNGSHITLGYDFKTFKDNIPADEVLQYKTDYKKIMEKLDFELYKNNEQVQAKKISVNESLSPDVKIVNWSACWVAFIFIILYTAFLTKLNTRKEEVQFEYETGWSLNGWVIVLGITIGLALLIQIVSLFTNSYFSIAVWEKLGALGGYKMQYPILFELCYLLFRIGGCIALLYWFFGRRDIFPAMFTWYIGCILGGQFVLFILYSVAHYPSSFGDLRMQTVIQFARTCFYGLIWVTYIRRSERVKFTFLRPFKK